MIDKKDYYNLEGYVNYSLLKNVSTSSNLAFSASEELSESRKKTFDIGHIFEKYFLEDKDLSYIKVDRTKDLSGHSVILKDALLKYCRDNSISDSTTISEEIILELISLNLLWSNVKKKEILMSYTPPILEKVNFLLSLQENDVIANMEVFDLINRAEEGLRKYPEVYNTLYPPEDVEIITQHPIVLEDIFDLPVKGLIDRIHIDRKNKVVDIIDFKTMEERVEKFIYSNFYQYKYYYQLPFYYRLFMEENAKLLEKYQSYGDNFNDYKINMKFIVMSKSIPDIPAVYILPTTWVDKAWNGWTTKNGIKIRGIHEIMEEIKWYKEFGGTSISYLLAQNNNILTIEEDWYE